MKSNGQLRRGPLKPEEHRNFIQCTEPYMISWVKALYPEEPGCIRHRPALCDKGAREQRIAHPGLTQLIAMHGRANWRVIPPISGGMYATGFGWKLQFRCLG